VRAAELASHASPGIVGTVKSPLRKRTGRALIGLIAVLLVAGGLWRVAGRDDTGGYRITLTPAKPLSLDACAAQSHRLGGSSGDDSCRAGEGKPWFRLRLRNVSDSRGFPVCHAKAFDAGGDALFEDDVVLAWIHFPQGPEVRQGTSVAVRWYFGVDNPLSYFATRDWSVDQIDHYTAECHGRDASDLPI
jgi:hypothetical protein